MPSKLLRVVPMGLECSYMLMSRSGLALPVATLSGSSRKKVGRNRHETAATAYWEPISGV